MTTGYKAVNLSPFWPAGEPFELTLPEGTLVAALRRTARSTPDKPAIFFYARTITAKQLDDEVEQLAWRLRTELGVAKGDRVLLCLQNSPQFIIAFQAVLRADAVAISANPMYKTLELEHIVQETEARVAIVGADVARQAAPLAGAHLQHVIVARYRDYLPPAVEFRLPEVLSGEPEPLPDHPAFVEWQGHSKPPSKPVLSTATRDDLALLIYTSGTTGKPKACMHTHGTMLFTAYSQERLYAVKPDSVIAGFQPLFHVGGMQHSMNTPIVAGVPVVLMTRWDREVALQMIQRHKITYLNAPPTMVVDLLAKSDVNSDALRSLKLITGGGSAMPEAVAAELKSRTGLPYVEAYGMTEVMSPSHINPLDHPKRQCGGIPVHETESLIIDPETLSVLPTGETGEIVISGPQMFKGYWRRPDADALAFITIDGKRFYRTGDLGRQDEENYIFLSDRLKRMINASGYKVWPAEVEAMLYEHPAIQECAVISTPDAYRGESVKAVVVLKPDAPKDIKAEDIVSWARSRMAVYKAPRGVVFSGPLPRTPSNKIDWRVLQDREWAKGK